MLRMSTPSPLSRSLTADSLELGASAASPPSRSGDASAASVKRELFSPKTTMPTEMSAVEKAKEFLARRKPKPTQCRWFMKAHKMCKVGCCLQPPKPQWWLL